MADRKIQYEVDVNTSDAVRDMRRLGEAGEDAGKGIAKGFEDAETKSTRAIKGIVEGLDKAAAEAKRTMDVVGKIGQSFGDGFDANSTAGLVQSLRKAGAEFDDIEANADQLIAAMKRIDDVKLDAASSGMTKLGTDLDTVRGNADQSRSVLANMAGNAAQDLGQLGGVVGTLGVGIGQMAEYAVDGNIALSGLAKVAGPMAALAGATFLVQQAMSRMAKEDALDAARAQAWTEAIAEGGDNMSIVVERLREAKEIFTEPQSSDIFGLDAALFGDDPINIIEKLQEIGVNVNDVAATFADLRAQGVVTEEAFRGSEKILAVIQALDVLGLSGEELQEVVEGLWNEFDAFNSGLDAAAKTAEFFALTADDVNDALGRIKLDEDPFSQFQQVWAAVIGDLRDGKADFETTGRYVEFLAEQLGVSTDAVIEMANTKIADEIEKVGEAFDEAAEGVVSYGDAVGEAARVMGSAEWENTAFAAAQTALDGFFLGADSTLQRASDVEEAWDNLRETFADTEWGVGGPLNPSTPEGRAFIDSLGELGTSLIPAIGTAYRNSEGDINKFNESMTDLAESTLVRLQSELGISRDEANHLLQQLGLTPESVSTMYELLGTEEAQLKLSLLQSALDLLPEEVQLEIAALVSRGEWVAAADLAEQYLTAGGPATLSVNANIQPFADAMALLRAQIALQTLFVNVAARPVTGGSGGGGGGGGGGATAQEQMLPVGPSTMATATTFAGDEEDVVVAESPAQATATLVPYGAAAPTVYNNTYQLNLRGVIGDRFAVQRVVSKAIRSAERLGGTRSRR